MPRDITQLAIDIWSVYGGKKAPYAYGCSGESPSSSLRASKTKQYPSSWSKTSNRLYRDDDKAFMGAAFWTDCIGFALRMLCLYDRKLRPIGCGGPGKSPWVIGGKNLYSKYLGNSKSKYCMDISAAGCNSKYGGKPISTLPEPTPTQAIWVFMKNSSGKVSHIGLYIGGGKVIEQTPKWLAKTDMKSRKWHYWGYVPTHMRDFVEVELGVGSKMDVSVPGAAKPPVSTAKPKPVVKPTKTEKQVAWEIYQGKGGWGNAPTRVKKLTEAGYNAKKVQTIVNEICRAFEVYRGKGGWGNNPGRRKKLEAAGYNYSNVQAFVNTLIKTKGKSPI
jgi:hypothetical protein